MNSFVRTQPTMVQSVKFIKSTNTFQAKIVWKELNSEAKKTLKGTKKKNASSETQPESEFIEHEDIIDVEEEWIKSEFEPMFDYIVNIKYASR